MTHPEWQSQSRKESKGRKSHHYQSRATCARAPSLPLFVFLAYACWLLLLRRAQSQPQSSEVSFQGRQTPR